MIRLAADNRAPFGACGRLLCLRLHMSLRVSACTGRGNRIVLLRARARRRSGCVILLRTHAWRYDRIVLLLYLRPDSRYHRSVVPRIRIPDRRVVLRLRRGLRLRGRARRVGPEQRRIGARLSLWPGLPTASVRLRISRSIPFRRSIPISARGDGAAIWPFLRSRWLRRRSLDIAARRGARRDTGLRAAIASARRAGRSDIRSAT